MSQDKPDVARRGFLKLAAVAAPATAALAAGTESAEAAEPETTGDGLRKTAHVKAYLESARF
ncbi:twin-arginine translocation pathway signal protein [Algicella marina]|uniref:Twin-arginine translocation pathway signal protein n=1 Tax=Algicella marina TaxID=2683284 RepID=A0A6P1T098_9RHOB|nr:twin-arginine translocation pathway signal protein [Algicella marina]QHQ35280.1 twin-arginine translocation pathway signal protein [Algicella marina]